MTYFITIIFGCLGIILWLYFIAVRPDDLVLYFFSCMFGALLTIFGSIFGCFSLFELVRKKGDIVLHILRVFVATVSVSMMIYSICFIAIPRIRIDRRGDNISEISIALVVYWRAHSGELPDGSSWCDVLVNNEYITAKQLVIPLNDKAKRNYALNVYVPANISDVPDDIVLLFESKAGWNLVSDKELLVGDNHEGGCWILFGNLDVRYIHPEEFKSLQWEIEDN